MKKLDIFTILSDWNAWNAPFETGVSRPFYVNKMRGMLALGQVLIITGARRSGKSFLMRQLAQDIITGGVAGSNVLFVNFEDPRWRGLNTSLLDRIVETYRERIHPTEKPYIFLDEVQEVSGWEKWVRTLHELDKATIILSGSNANLLSKELGTVLTGRHVDVTVYPLSFREFLTFCGIDPDAPDTQLTDVRSAFHAYKTIGSFPGLARVQQDTREWFVGYHDDVIGKDIIRRFRVRKSEEIKALLGFYMGNIAKLASYNATAKRLSISPTTVEKFTSYFEAGYILFALRRFSPSVHEQHKSQRKIYCIDTALAAATGFRMNEDYGRMAENMVYIEYLRQAIKLPREVFYWKDPRDGRDGKEVDFVVKEKNSIKEIVQVCMGDYSGTTKKRELRSLKKAAAVLAPEKMFVITDEIEGMEKYDFGTVECMPLWKWLMRK